MPTVIVYSSDTCGYCHKAKAFLKANGVAFTEKNVNTDSQAQKEMMAMKAQGVPVIKVDDEVIMGFDQPRLEALLGKNVIECPKCRAKMKIPRDKGLLQVSCPMCQEKFRVQS